MKINELISISFFFIIFSINTSEIQRPIINIKLYGKEIINLERAETFKDVFRVTLVGEVLYYANLGHPGQGGFVLSSDEENTRVFYQLLKFYNEK